MHLVISHSEPANAGRAFTGLRNLSIITILGLLGACSGESGGNPVGPAETVASVVVSAPATSMRAGQTAQLTASARDASGNTIPGKTFVWASTSDAVSTVSSDGLVTAVAPGTATIRATVDGKSGEAVLTITPPPVLVQVTPSAATVPVGGTQQLVAVLRDAGGAALTGRTVTWTSSNPAVASVFAGVVSAHAAGQATITATTEGGSGTVPIVVNAPVPSAARFPGRQFPTGAPPRDVKLRDVNGDDRADMIVLTTDGIGVLLGRGDGTFGDITRYAVGPGPTAFALGDMNGDGRADIVATNSNRTSSTVSVLLSQGGGSFATASYAVTSGATDVALGDLNRDGRLDVAVASIDAARLQVLLGTGGGALGPATTYATGAIPKSVTLGDATGDGRPDAVVGAAGSDSLRLLRGNGDGTFAAHTGVFVGATPQPEGARLEDLNRDGRADLVVLAAERGTPNLGVMLGNGNGTFRPVTFLAPSSVNAYAVYDVNGDGVLDVVASSNQRVVANALFVQLGRGDGTFGAAVRVDTRANHLSVAAADLDGDGRADIAYANGDSHFNGNPLTVTVLAGNGDGTFRIASGLATPPSRKIESGDLNGDGRLDLVTGTSTGGVEVQLGTGLGIFARASGFRVESHVSALRLGDMNGDGRLDVVAADGASSVHVALGNGDGSFAPAATYPVGSSPHSLALGDVNGDGLLDVLIANSTGDAPGTVSVLLNGGTGGLRTGGSHAVGPGARRITLGDLNGDGRLDVVTGNNGSYSVLLGNGEGAFGPASTHALGSNVFARVLALGDLNGDGRFDLVVASPEAREALVLLGNGNGTFQPATRYTVSGSANDVRLGDVNGDGRLDVVTLNSAGNASVLLGSGNGALAAPLLYGAGHDAYAVVLGDFGGDRRLDIAVANQEPGVSLLIQLP